MVPVAPVYRHVDSQGREHALKFNSASLRAQSRARIAKLMPSALLESRFRQVPHDRSGVSFLARTDHEVHVENAPLSASHIVTMVSALWGHSRWSRALMSCYLGLCDAILYTRLIEAYGSLRFLV